MAIFILSIKPADGVKNLGMRRLNLPLLLDTFFAGACAFLLFFTAVRYYTKNPVIGLIFGIVAALLFGALAYLYISGRQNKRLLLSRDERNKTLLSLHLSLSSDYYIRKLFLSLFGEGARTRGMKIVLGDVAYFFCFKMHPISEDDVARVIKYRWEGKKHIYCAKCSPQAAALAANFLIEITGIDGVYSALKDKQLLPEKYVYEGAEKIKFFKRIRMRFNKRLSAPLFWSGAGLLALSYFTFFPIYYIVSGSIMLILAAVALVVNQS